MAPTWLHALSAAYLALGLLCDHYRCRSFPSAAAYVDHERVWPTTALFGTVWIVWQYFPYGRLASHRVRAMRSLPASGSRRFPSLLATPRSIAAVAAVSAISAPSSGYLLFPPSLAHSAGTQSL